MFSRTQATCNIKQQNLQAYDPEQESNYVMYWDAHNLYEWAMSECLPLCCLEFDNHATFTFTSHMHVHLRTY